MLLAGSAKFQCGWHAGVVCREVSDSFLLDALMLPWSVSSSFSRRSCRKRQVMTKARRV